MSSVQSRRDDLESLGYVLVYLMSGTVSWQNFHLPAIHRAKVAFLSDLKLHLRKSPLKCTFPHFICMHAPAPAVVMKCSMLMLMWFDCAAVSVACCIVFIAHLRKYFEYVQSLGFSDAPNYEFCKSIFVEALALDPKLIYDQRANQLGLWVEDGLINKLLPHSRSSNTSTSSVRSVSINKQNPIYKRLGASLPPMPENSGRPKRKAVARPTPAVPTKKRKLYRTFSIWSVLTCETSQYSTKLEVDRKYFFYWECFCHTHIHTEWIFNLRTSFWWW